ncbi:pentapeptide repeat-containing protein, partial [Candidatus Woesearchaeota archaeon]|nr:pentapeptide repeat-containing protein [Candidatus Woesearchaeota archaeon]
MPQPKKYMKGEEFMEKVYWQGERDLSNIRLEEFFDVGKYLGRYSHSDLEHGGYNNKFTEENPLILNGSELVGLTSSSLRWPYVQAEGAKFSRAWLGGAQFPNSNFRGATFGSAYLLGAHFRHSDLSGVSFRGANLSNADLSFAVFGYANERDTDFSEANLSETNLVGVEGLDKVL